MKVIGIIPARYDSTRFPGKPLADIFGKPMIQHVYERATIKIETVVIATDDERILSCAKSFGGKVVMTSKEHKTGTSRCIETLEKYCEQYKTGFDLVVNIQGDEPTLEPSQFDELLSCFSDVDTDIATLIKRTENSEEIFNPNTVKVVYDKNYFALYFSRSPIPFLRNTEGKEWHKHGEYYKHIGLYAFRTSVIKQLRNLKPCVLEESESLEQLNWLFHGYKIKTIPTKFNNVGIDTPEDLKRLIESEK